MQQSWPDYLYEFLKNIFRVIINISSLMSNQNFSGRLLSMCGEDFIKKIEIKSAKHCLIIV